MRKVRYWRHQCRYCLANLENRPPEGVVGSGMDKEDGEKVVTWHMKGKPEGGRSGRIKNEKDVSNI